MQCVAHCPGQSMTGQRFFAGLRFGGRLTDCGPGTGTVDLSWQSSHNEFPVVSQPVTIAAITSLIRGKVPTTMLLRNLLPQAGSDPGSLKCNPLV